MARSAIGSPFGFLLCGGLATKFFRLCTSRANQLLRDRDHDKSLNHFFTSGLFHSNGSSSGLDDLFFDFESSSTNSECRNVPEHTPGTFFFFGSPQPQI